MNIVWHWCALDDLSAPQLYAVLAARSAVFVVEQNSIYQDMDGLDLQATHLVGWAHGQVAAYLRVLGPHTRYAERSFGRVLTTQPFRGTGVGRMLVAKGMEYLDARHPHDPVRIGAQAHLQPFYASFGFAVASEPYLEDGIPHVQMLRRR